MTLEIIRDSDFVDWKHWPIGNKLSVEPIAPKYDNYASFKIIYVNVRTRPSRGHICTLVAQPASSLQHAC